MGRPQPSVVKRQREQAKRERAQAKVAKKEQRKREKVDGEPDTPEDDDTIATEEEASTAEITD